MGALASVADKGLRGTSERLQVATSERWGISEAGPGKGLADPSVALRGVNQNGKNPPTPPVFS